MKRREQSIIYQLAVSERPMTADELAKCLAVSTRTIKSDMDEVRTVLSQVGAVLMAKRNEGYSIRIIDENKFHQFFEQLSFKSSIIHNFIADDEASILYIARKLVSSSRFVKLEDIADELYTSRSSLRGAVKRVMGFLESCHLETESKPGLGVRTFGTEHHMRIAMMELFAVHFHKVLLDHAGMEYAKWTECDYEERQDIRHSFLKSLREGSVRISDVNTQRLSIYFIVVRNRCRAGYRLRLPEQWKEEVREYEEFETATRIFSNLKKEFEGFDLPEEETIFLSVYLICNRDMGGVNRLQSAYGPLAEKADALVKELAGYMKDQYHIRLLEPQWAAMELGKLLIILLAKIHFDLNGMERFWYDYENQALNSPVAAELAAEMADYLSGRLCVRLSTAIYSQLASFVYKIISMSSYEIKPMKLLLVNSDGMSLNDITQQRILNRYDRLVESCTWAELYEIRGMRQEDYDAVLSDTGEISYNYDLPFSALHTLPGEKELDMVFNKILIHAYQAEVLLLGEEQIEVNRDFHYLDEKQFIQFITYRHAKNQEDRICCQEWHERQASRRKAYVPARLAILFSPGTGQEAYMELYCLDAPGLWGGEEIDYLLYICVDFEWDWKMVKAYENALRLLSSDASYVAEFAREGRKVLVEMLQKCLKRE